ncbi:hydroxylamine reductase [Aetokthonos hydrillicola Thurmond2011]|uniref:Hydroxylamine reductase n=2 Tax=Aetokthonos TaxID=1550243 RepID=A0AAP5I656_9CYAN|nr:hydroxylamine reductase [Aetokthonos hydrillicola]MBO3458333.1 hydroxylamine reductase [Aetokthonos hydrillicola CCALA 1050]MBW4585897.1 hydroxylamine reductase [Aetokthonos hydrillicola CCALA 1050]MDR9893878.1 hydroxylamine reductase [Aetokthonos hydrillicola Thurmond2011]
MFCEQCEQTASGQGCHQWGACGKSPEVNGVQDLLIYCLRGLAPVALRAREFGISTHEVDVFNCEAIFATMTNVNFDQKRFIDYIRRAIAYREQLKLQIEQATGVSQNWSELSCYEPCFDSSLSEQGQDLTLKFISQSGKNVDIFSLKLTVLYGLKGVASYAFHAQELGQEDERVYQFCYEALAKLDTQDLSLDDWVSLALKVGEINLRTMELLDAGHTNTYGHPVPTKVALHPKAGKAILVSGHDIPQLEAVLKQTVDTGITVYTHGELLPAHGYPLLKKIYPHFYGHYGTAWQNQTKEFAKFPGAIIITTNCLMPPHDNYEDKLFSIGPVGFPGLNYLATGVDGSVDFTPAIRKALELRGFTEDEVAKNEPRQVTTGFARNAVLSVADQIIAAVKGGQIRHFFLVGGCDGAKPDRNYYAELVEKVPNDCIVLTLACGKFRFFDKDLGHIGGIPRLLDMGQCNDAYSAIQIAIALAKAFEVDVNQLPLSMILSWYEQKAVAILLTLLHLGIKDIRLGPTLPAFISPNVFKLLSQKYNLAPITEPDADLAACLA